jgi:transposase-like protein
MIKNGKRLNARRVYSEDYRLKFVKFYESGKHTVRELEKIYDISNPTIYKWIYKYSTYNKKSIKVVELKDSQMYKLKELQNRIAELERALGQKQMNIDYLEKMIELAKEGI